MFVKMRISHRTSVQHYGMLEKVALAIGRILKSLEKVCHLAYVVCVKPCVFLDFFRLFAMMRKNVKWSFDTACRINPLAAVDAKLKGHDPCEIRLKSQKLKIKHQLHMIVEGIRDTGRRIRNLAS